MCLSHGQLEKRNPERRRWIVLPSSRLVPPMKGMFAILPCDRSFEGRSGMSPPGPSITGVNRNSPGIKPFATFQAEIISSVVAFWAQGMDVPRATVPLHPGTFATKVSQAGWRWEALKSGSALPKPDSMIYKP